jgi:hypothetical protein
LTIGSLGNPWIGNIALNNFSFSGVSGTNNAVTIYTDSGDITLDNVDVAEQAGTGYTALLDSNSGDILVQNGSTFSGTTTGNNRGHGFSANTDTGSIMIAGTSGANITFNNSRGQNPNNYDGASLSAPTISLSYVTASGNDGNGISITDASLVTLSNVSSGPNTNNQGNGLSGVLINGTGSTVAIVSGGVFADNGSYGIEILNGSLYIQSTPTCPTTNPTSNGSGCYNVTPLTDTTAPVITSSLNGTLGNNGWYTSDVSVSWNVSDPETGISSSSGCSSTNLTSETTGTSLICSATNNVGLSGSNSVTIKIDKTAPVIAFVSRTPADANGWNNTDVTINWSCTDGLSGPVSASVSQTVSTEGANQSATGTCQDLAGNTASDTQSGINIDKTAPTLSLPSDMIVEGSSLDGAVVNYSVTSTDNLDAAPIIDCSPASGSFFVVGTTMVNCTATDHADNTSFGNFNITVQDTTAPIIDPHGDVTAEATSASGANVSYSNPATSDIVDGPGVASCSPTSGSLFPLGNTPVNCTATDSNGNNATPISFMVHVVDTTAPVIAAHADVFVAATSLLGAVVTYTSPGTSDIVDGSGFATCAPLSGSQFPIGNTTVTCNATDSHGNDALPTSFVVHVIDTAAPVIDGHLDVTVEATSAAGATATYTSPATTDAVDGPGVATCSPASGSFFNFGNTTVTCTAVDSNNNPATPTTFVVHVVDTTAPVIASHADVTVTTTNAFGTIVAYSSPATSDAVDGAKTATCIPASGSFFAVGDTLVTCSATDAHGNTAQPVTFTVNVAYQPGTPTPAPTAQAPVTQTQENSLSIPVTSGLLDLDCLSVIESVGIKVTFHNLCDYQALVSDASTDTLPAQLPDQYSFVQGLNVLVLFEQQVVKALPIGTGVQLDFPVPANTQDQFAVLLWDDENGDGNGEWLDVTQLIVDKDLSKVLSANPYDELYQIMPTKTLESLYRVVTTEKTGTFVLVKK